MAGAERRPMGNRQRQGTRVLTSLLFLVSMLFVLVPASSAIATDGGASQVPFSPPVPAEDWGQVHVTGTARDSDGNLFLIGWSIGAVRAIGADGQEVTIEWRSSAPEGFLIRYGSTGNIDWAVRVSATRYTRGIVVDPYGNALVTGVYGLNSSWITLTRVLSDGVTEWSAWIGPSPMNAGAQLQVDSEGNAYLYGSVINFPPTFVPRIGTGDNQIELPTGPFLARYFSNGSLDWVISAPQGSIQVNPDGSVVVTGAFSGEVVLGAGDQQVTLQAVGEVDSYVARYRKNGTLEWATAIPRACIGTEGVELHGHLVDGENPVSAGSVTASTVRLTAIACQQVGAVTAQGGTVAWATTLERAIYGEIVTRHANRKNTVLQWNIGNMNAGTVATATFEVSGTIGTGDACGSTIPLTGEWSISAATGTGTAKWDRAEPVLLSVGGGC
jgi:hypothetical protein